MTCGVRRIDILTKMNRRLLMLAKENHNLCSPFVLSFSTNNDTSNTGQPQPPIKPKKHPIINIPDEEITKSVFISQSHDIFTNLALETWMYRNFDFTTHHVLMLWSNDPCVVIGRHQNPTEQCLAIISNMLMNSSRNKHWNESIEYTFSEANVTKLRRNVIELARRDSGGGTVYHDRGNINLTFFTPRERYNRSYNLNIITRALFREWEIKTDISTRDDITLNGNKISGSAAKLGQKNAYHHCTLLVNTDKSRLKDALVRADVLIDSRATVSVRSPVKNLSDVNCHVNVAQLETAIGYEFLRTAASTLDDGGRDLMMDQRGFQLINPTENWYPGLNEIRDEFASWHWRFGKTPKFSVLKTIQLKCDGKQQDVQLKITVENGQIQHIVLVMPNCETTIPVISTLCGKPYDEDNLFHITNATKAICLDNFSNAIDQSI